MLNFSKINIILIYFIFFIISTFAFLNFQNKNNPILDKKVNLGLDLQGGSYLLLEINSDSLVEEKIQSKVIPIKKLLKENNIKFNNFKINNSSLNFTVDDLDKFELVFFSKKDNLVNPYIDNYRSHELDFSKLNDNFIEAKRLLGRPYTFSGKVVYGQQLGRQLDVPTANIWMPKQKLPISGVYAVNVRVEDKIHNGIANMGIRPTVGGTSPVLEVHIFNFSKDIYAKRIEVEFFKKIREEKKFKSIDLLKLQIQKDIEQAKKLLS